MVDTPFTGEALTAAKRYAELKGHRTQAESRARRCAKLTLPRLWVEEGSKSRAPGSAYIDTGPKCVNALASKIVLAWLPPNAGVFKLSPDQAVAEAIAAQAGVERSDLEAALVEVEREVINDLETSGIRPVLSEAAKHAIVSGNFLLYDPDEGRPKLYPLNHYVVDRDGLGNLLEIVTLDKIAPALLPEEIRQQVVQKLSDQRAMSAQNADVNLYTWVKRGEDGKTWDVVQEVEGVTVPETFATYPLDACPWIPFASPPSLVDDYGEGLVYDYIGAFESLEALRKAIRKGAAALAKIVLFLKPTSTIRERQLTEAESGAVLRGDANDITTLQLQKAYDLNFVRQEADALSHSLEIIFGVRSAIQRPGERVTAYEIRVLTQELDDALSGFMALSGEQLLLPLIRRRLDKLQRAQRLPAMPPELIQPRITVGIAALGRGHDLNRLIEFGEAAKALIGEAEVQMRLNSGEALSRLSAAADIPAKGLIKSDEELQAEQQASTMQDAMVRAAPNLANAAMNPSM